MRLERRNKRRINADRTQKHNAYAECTPDKKAVERFRRPAYDIKPKQEVNTMSIKQYKILKCDKCGKELQLNAISTKAPVRFEAIPDDWENSNLFGHLCPECKAEKDKLLQGFLKKDEG